MTEPLTRLDGVPHTVVGVSSENLKWLGQEYFRNRATRPDPDPAKDQMRVMLASSSTAAAATGRVAASVTLTLPDGQRPRSERRSASALRPKHGDRLPAAGGRLLDPRGLPRPRARRHPRIRSFGQPLRPRAGENAYSKAYLYTDTLESVVDVKDRLVARGYNPVYDTTRLLETMKYAGALDLLFIIVFLGVIGFGILTVVVVFGDITNRKRGAIGIMRASWACRRSASSSSCWCAAWWSASSGRR